MEKKNDLKVPQNTSDRNEIIAGLNGKDIAVIACVGIVCIAMAVVIYMFTENMAIGCLGAFGILALTFMIVVRDRIGENLIDKFKIWVRYLKMQKQFFYKKTDLFNEVENG